MKQTKQTNDNELLQRITNPQDIEDLPTYDEVVKILRLNSAEDIILKVEKVEIFRSLKNPVFEIFTKEFVSALASYLSKRAEELGTYYILEVGAGNGKLAHLLNSVPRTGFHIIPTDSGDWKSIDRTKYPVEAIKHTQALEKYKPRIILTCWMPLGIDWTRAIRSYKSVQEYILIGEGPGGCCGSDNTWYKYGKKFVRENLTNIEKWQICRLDKFIFREKGSHSSTISFKRKGVKDGRTKKS